MPYPYYEGDGTLDFYPISRLWVHLDHEILYLTIDGETIETTPEHPFFLDDEHWVAARELWVGAKVRQADGSYGIVEATRTEQRPQVMYNLTVDTAHTYFVGEGGWLVHNADCGVSRLPLPPRPGNVSANEFGTNIMKWGGGHDEARERIGTLTLEELQEKGVTLEMAEAWRDFYINEMTRSPKNPSAAGRADLMQYAVELLGGK